MTPRASFAPRLRIWFILSAVLLSVPLPTPSHAATAQSQEELADESAASREMRYDEEENEGRVHGTVTVVDGAAGSFEVQNDADDLAAYRFSVNMATSFTGADSIAGLAAGDTVAVDYYDAESVHVADIVVVEAHGLKNEDELKGVEKVLAD